MPSCVRPRKGRASLEINLWWYPPFINHSRAGTRRMWIPPSGPAARRA